MSAGADCGIGKAGSVTINNVQGEGRDQWISLYYANGDYRCTIHFANSTDSHASGLYLAKHDDQVGPVPRSLELVARH